MNRPPDARVPAVSPALPRRTWRVLLALLARLPQAAFSRTLGGLADLPLPLAWRAAVLGGTARALGIDLAEAELPLTAYPSINALFVRRLKPGLRPLPVDESVIVSPVDGILGQCGTMSGLRVVQAKGRTYSAADLLADASLADRFDGGAFVTLYLSPRHYHRIHAPHGGVLPLAAYVPGALLPVNEPAVMHIPDLFPRNERLWCLLDAGATCTAVVAVGAYNVGRISTTFDTDWRPAHGAALRRRPHRPERKHYDPPLRVSRGEEIMAFHLGSTVVLLLAPGTVLTTDAVPGRELRLGQPLARSAGG